MAQINLAWTAVGGATSYEVFRSNTTGGPYSRVASPATNSYNDTGLPGGTTYFYVVRAVNANGVSSFSSQASATTFNTPGTPATPTVSSGNGTVTANWVAPSTGGSAITGYRVTLKLASDGSTVAQTTVGVVLTHQFTGLTNGTAYVVSVAAINSQGTGSDSTNSASTTPSTVPDAPRNVVATAGAASATVNWTPPLSNGGAAITGYRVTPYIGAAAQATTSVGNVTTATISGLTNGTAYTFKVEAQNARGFSAQSAASAAVTPSAAAVPGAPTIASVVAGNANATLTVTMPASTGGSAITKVRITPRIAGVAQATTEFDVASSYTVTSLANGTAYTFTAAVKNTTGYSAESTASSAVTPSAGAGTVTVTFVVGDTVTLHPGDTAIRDRMVARGWTVTLVAASSAQDSTSRSLTVVSESGLSSDVGTKYSTLAQGAVLLEGFAADSWNLASADPGSFVSPPTARVNTTHAAAGGLTVGSYSLAASGEIAPFPNANLPAAANKFLTSDATPTNVYGWAVESGAAILNAASATARRVVLGWQANVFSGSPTVSGWAIFDAACDWVRSSSGTITAPSAPYDVTATGGDSQAIVRWTAPYSGGSPITGYIVTPYIGTTAQTPTNVGNVATATVTGLTNGTAYTFTVKATNAIGTSAASVASAAVTPSASSGIFSKTIGVNHDGVPALQSSWPQYGMVYRNPWFKESVAEVKAVNPDCLVGGYRCAASFRPGLYENRLGRITYASGWDRDPTSSWYINSTGANPTFQWRYFPGLYFADLEQSAVRNAWVEDTLAWAAWGGFDAIFLDNATYRNVGPFGYGEPSGWSQARYKAAMLSHLAVLGPAMHDAGIFVFANLGSSDMSAAEAREHLAAGSNNGAAWRFCGSFEYVGHFDGAADRWDPYWISQLLAYADEAASLGLGFLPLASHVAQSDTTTKRLCRAMQHMTMAPNTPNFLLMYDGNSFYPPDSDFDVEIGQPLAPRYAVGSGLRRDFSGGISLMTHTNTSQTFNLGANYRRPDGGLTSSVTLAGTSGMALSNP